MTMYKEAISLETSSDKVEKLTELVDYYLISELQKNGLI
jgi:hypothetical protein